MFCHKVRLEWSAQEEEEESAALLVGRGGGCCNSKASMVSMTLIPDIQRSVGVDNHIYLGIDIIFHRP